MKLSLLGAVLLFNPLTISAAQADGYKPPSCSQVHARVQGTVITVNHSSLRIDDTVSRVAREAGVSRSSISYCNAGNRYQTVISSLDSGTAKEVSGKVCSALNRKTNSDGTCLNVSWISK